MAMPERAQPVELPDLATLAQAVARLVRRFREAGLDTPGLDARRLLQIALGDEAGLALVREPERILSVDERLQLEKLARRRLDREPVSRIAGCRAFRGLDFEIGPATLDPRPDSELLVEGVLELVRGGLVPNGDAPRILDLGTGSGALLIALLKALPRACGVGVDISEAALQVAARNAGRHGVIDRAQFRWGSWFEGITGWFDVVISNPPYIASGEIAALEPDVRRFDPVAALDGGLDGLECYRAISQGIRNALGPEGWVVLELGEGQLEAVERLLCQPLGGGSGATDRRIWSDLGGVARTVALRARR